MKSLVDGEPFLEMPTSFEGSVLYLNYELSEAKFRRWLRTLTITNTDRVIPWNLRGRRLDILTPDGMDLLVRTSVEHAVQLVIIDPFARAFIGDENSNTDVGAYLEALDEFKLRANVSDSVVVAHTGRASDTRTRGATRLDDWPDSLWMYTKDDDGIRTFSAEGRSGAVAAFETQFNDIDRRIIKTGTKVERKLRGIQENEDQRKNRIRTVLANEPMIVGADLERECGGDNKRHRATRDQMVTDGEVGFLCKGNAKCYYLVSEKVSAPPRKRRAR